MTGREVIPLQPSSQGADFVNPACALPTRYSAEHRDHSAPGCVSGSRGPPPASRRMIAHFVVRALIISSEPPSSGMPAGTHSKVGAAPCRLHLCCSLPMQAYHISTMNSVPTTFCSLAANRPAVPRRCTGRPRRGFAFQCSRACARSTWRLQPRWWSEKLCGRRVGQRYWTDVPVKYRAVDHEAGEGRSHAPRRYPSPASLAGAGRRRRLPIPKQTWRQHTPRSPTPARSPERMAK